MRKVALIIVAIALVIAIYKVSRSGSGPSKPRGPSSVVHSAAPDFSLQDLDGKQLDLANYRGRVVLLDFWATWCTPCRGEIPHFVELQDKYRDRGLQVIGISMDDNAKPVREFYRQF
jgi:thiol-disulfide isomerase/thioredoxin